MSAKLLNWQLLVGFGLVFAGSGVLLHLKKSNQEPTQLKYWEVVDALRAHPDRFRLECLTVTEDPRLGFIVARAEDQRPRENLASMCIHERRGFAVLVRLEGFTLREPLTQIRFADCEMSGDLELLEEVIETLRGQK